MGVYVTGKNANRPHPRLSRGIYQESIQEAFRSPEIKGRARSALTGRGPGGMFSYKTQSLLGRFRILWLEAAGIGVRALSLPGQKDPGPGSFFTLEQAEDRLIVGNHSMR